MSAAKHVQPNIVKADVTIPVPGSTSRFFTIGGKSTSGAETALIASGRHGMLDIFYKMYREHPTVRAAIDKIAKVAVTTGYTFQPESPEQELNEERARELRLFFRKSNGGQLLKATYKDLLIFGDAYWWIERGRAGAKKPIRAKRLNPKYVDIQFTGAEITEYRYGGLAPTTKATGYDPEVIVHFRLDDPDNDLYGLPPLYSLQRTVATDLFAMDYNGNFFENSAQTGVIFNMKNTSEEEVARNRAWLELNYVGTRNAHKPLILEGDVEVARSVSTAAEMQFLELRRFAREEILSVLDVPLTKVSIAGDANRSTSKEDDNSFREENVASLQAVAEEEISNSLILVMFGWDDILFKHREISKRDMLALTKMLAELERMGAFSPNEVRAEIGMGKVDGGETHFIQTAAGLLPLSMIQAYADKLLSGIGTDTPLDPSAPSISDLPFDDSSE